jgi:autotransporter-associated beta strand protein
MVDRRTIFDSIADEKPKRSIADLYRPRRGPVSQNPSVPHPPMKPKFIHLRHLCPLIVSLAMTPLHATVSVVGVDSSTGPNWRTDAALETDGEYGTLGYVIFGLNVADSTFSTGWDIGAGQPGNVYNLPAGVALTTADANIGMWSGNGNFGMLQDPQNANQLTPTPLLANSAGPKQFTISRSISAAYRITLITASGDNSNATYSANVNDGSGAVSTSYTHTSNGVAYHVFEVSEGTSEIVINLTSTPNWSLTGLAFDEIVADGPPLVWIGATDVWDTTTAGNWKLAADGNPAFFANWPLQPVRFDDTATSTTVRVAAAGVMPRLMEFVNPSKNFTIQGEGDIGGFGGLIKTGAGSLTILNRNTYSGSTEIHGGTLILSGAGQLGGGTYGGAILNDGQIIFSSTPDQILAGTISGSGGITHNGPATLTVAGVNTYAGSVRITGGTFVASRPTQTSASGAFGNLQLPEKTITVETGATLRHGNNDLYFNSPAGYTGAASRLILAGSTLDTGTYFSSIKTLELHSGAAVTGSNGVNNQFRSLALVGTVTVKGGSGAASTIDAPGAAGGIHLGNSNYSVSSATFDVDAASEGLIINAPLYNQANTLNTGNLVKIGDGTLTLAGTNYYTGSTTVHEGTLNVTGTLESATGAVSINDGATLTGNGAINRPVTIAAGGKLVPAGSEIDTLGIATLTLGAESTTVMQFNKSGGSIQSDLIEADAVTFGGMLELVGSGAALALGDSIKLFEVSGTYSGSFSNIVRPTLPAGLQWDFSRLATDGTVTVVNTAPTPVFSLPSGGYAGAPSITIAAEPGTTIHYTTDGSDPRTSPTKISVASPATGVVVPTDRASFTITAYSTQLGYSDSSLVTATYSTIATPAWNVDEDGAWSQASNWKHHVVPNGAGVTADFNAFPQTADANVTLDSSRTVGGLVFGNSNGFDWTLSATPGSTLTFATPSDTPRIEVVNQTASVAVPIGGTQGFVKAGEGLLRLTSPQSSFTGDITIAEGTVHATTATGGLNPTTGSLGSAQAERTITLAAGTTLGLGSHDILGNHLSAPNVAIRAGAGASLVNIGNFFNILGPVTLDGASIHAIGGANATFPSFAFKGTVTALTGTTSTISGEGPNVAYHLGESDMRTISFDVQGNGQLDITAPLENGRDNQYVAVSTNLVKTGTGTLTLAAANTYTGNTEVQAGTLVLAESGQLRFTIGATSGASNRLSGSGTAILNGTFVIDTAAAGALEAGSWTLENIASLTGPYSPTFAVADADGTLWTDAGNDTWTKDNGAGVLWVFDETTGTLVLGEGSSGNFGTWASEHGVTGGAIGDSDFDGIPNLVEYALNLNPAGSDPSPGTFADGLLSFAKRDLAVSHGDVSYTIEVSTDLGETDPWVAVTPTVNNDSVISYALPTTGPRRFVRLSVKQVP